MNVHIYHHFDADGFASASVLIRYVLAKVPREDIRCYVCEHSTSMDLSSVEKNEFVFIVDYSFPDSDRENLINLYNNVTENIIWIDHHSTSDIIIKEGAHEFSIMARKGLIETSNRYAGCLLTYLWHMKNKFVDISHVVSTEKYGVIPNIQTNDLINNVLKSGTLEDVYSVAPLYIQLVSDHDTFKHRIPGSAAFSRGLSFEGLTKSFIDPEEKNSFTNALVNSSYEKKLIDDITMKGQVILDSDDRKNKAILERNKFEKIFSVSGIDEEGNAFTKRYNVLCLNEYGNSFIFGDLYEQYDAVCVFNYNGNRYKYSLYAKDDSPIDCSIIGLYYNAKYKINGGGHIHAAGWSTPKNIFEDGYVIEIDSTII